MLATAIAPSFGLAWVLLALVIAWIILSIVIALRLCAWLLKPTRGCAVSRTDSERVKLRLTIEGPRHSAAPAAEPSASDETDQILVQVSPEDFALLASMALAGASGAGRLVTIAPRASQRTPADGQAAQGQESPDAKLPEASGSSGATTGRPS